MKPGRGPSAAVSKLSPSAVLETYSAGIKLAQVARGEADVYVCDYDAMNDWDIAAGHILVTEAGGRVTTSDERLFEFGRPDPIQTGGLVASNGSVHDAVIARLSPAS
jgi:3'(2'), 5'-bisphosphate nucleotidase